jgi:tyrosinase
MSPPSTTTPVANPTWYADIRWMFTTTDVSHMAQQGVDLTSYDAVKSIASSIYGQVAAGNMPPKPNNWPPAWVATFLNWITTGTPKGTNLAPLTTRRAGAAVSKATRIRKDITRLPQAELDSLKKAFSAIVAKDPNDLNSYFAQASIHWLPVGTHPEYCMHHIPGYNPWHRAYLVSFENALRSVPGCESVTLPYWDITKPFPDVLKSPPFDQYTLPTDIGEGFSAGYVTQRYPYAQIQQNLVNYSVTDDINRALTKTDWEDFHGFWSGASYNTIIAAHDGAHVSIGPTMANPSVAAFDPVFWFFHSNWDRLFWEWQRQMHATNVNALLSTINATTDLPSYQLFTIPALGALPPFALTAVDIIDSETFLSIDYQDPGTAFAMNFLAKTQRSVAASQTFSVATDRVDVRVDGINRLKIPGSFSVHLLKDGQRIASAGFFQPNEANKCPTCVKNPIVHFDFEVPLAVVSAGQLSVQVEPVDQSNIGDRFPQKLMGSPTIDVHLLLTTE